MSDCFVFLENMAAISTIFGEKMPALSNVDLFEISLNRDGACIIFRFDFKEYPDSPPKKWANNGCNRVQATIEFYGVEMLVLEGWGSNVKIDISIVKSGNFLLIKGWGSMVKIEFKAGGGYVKGISAYRCRDNEGVIKPVSLYSEN